MKKLKFQPQADIATPKVHETKAQKRVEMKQIGKRANRACFSDENREQEREKSAHKMSQTFLKNASLSPRKASN